MPRLVQVLAFCENHPEEPAVTEHRITYGRGKPRLIDVCEECDKGIVQPLLELLALGMVFDKVVSLPPRPVTATADGHPCLLAERDGCEYVGPSRKAMTTHLRHEHHTGVRALRREGITG